MKRIAIIGAGIAGLSLAKLLSGKYDITIFEKSRGVGGRVATRRANPYSFDHGAQFFTVRTKEFKEFLKPMLDLGVITEWNARFVEFDKGKVLRTDVWGAEHPHYVGNPSMNSIAKFLREGLDLRLENKIVKISHENNTWSLFSDGDNFLGDFDWVVSTLPPAQASDLIDGVVDLKSFFSIKLS